MSDLMNNSFVHLSAVNCNLLKRFFCLEGRGLGHEESDSPGASVLNLYIHKTFLYSII